MSLGEVMGEKVDKQNVFGQAKVGDAYTYNHCVTMNDIERFADISGDKNPVHLDKEFAKKSIFKERIAHGTMLVSYFSRIFGTVFPGPGCVYISQSVKYLRAIKVNAKVCCVVSIKEIKKRKKTIVFDTSCFEGEIKVISGEAELYIP